MAIKSFVGMLRLDRIIDPSAQYLVNNEINQIRYVTCHTSQLLTQA